MSQHDTHSHDSGSTPEPARAVAVNSAWALGQLARARAALSEAQAQASADEQSGSQAHGNGGAAQSAVARALAKVAAWRQALAGMASGDIQVGSRQALRDVPAWVTPGVLHGGFASGSLMAGGAVLPHESHWLAQLAAGQQPGATAGDCAHIALQPTADERRASLAGEVDRAPLNDWFLTEAGMAQLLHWLDDGRWRITVAEEGALLCVAWLLREGYDTSAARLLDTLSPYWNQLRFYPIPAATPMPAPDHVSLRSAQDVANQLKVLPTSFAVLAQHEAIHVWRPLQDELVLLWLRAVPQALSPEGVAWPDGALHETTSQAVPRLRAGTRVAEGGLPVAQPDAAWQTLATAWHQRMRKAQAQHQRSRAHCRPGSHFGQLWVMLHQVLLGHALSDVQRQQLRFVLACQISKHGVPGDAQHQAWRAAQIAQTDTVWHGMWGQALARRLLAQGPFGPGDGVADLSAVLHAATPEEAAQGPHVPVGTPVWRNLRRKIRRAQQASVPALVAAGVVPSSEVLAQVLPASTAAQYARSMPDAASGQLLGALWRAFRRRRSLLLLNHESQLKFHELPWVLRLLQHAAQSKRPMRADVDEAAQAAKPRQLDMAELARGQALQQLDAAARLALTQFPQSAFPNPLLWEFRALAEQAGWAVPWVEELAADIFMGSFTPKFGQAIDQALPWLAGSLYAQHFRLDLPVLRELVAPAVAFGNAAHEQSQAGVVVSKTAKRELDALFKRWLAQTGLLDHLRGRAGLAASDVGVGANGALIEQLCIVSTANFAPLGLRFGWSDEAAAQASTQAPETWRIAAQQAFASLCAQLVLALRESAAAQAAQAALAVPATGHAFDRLLAERVRRAAVTWRQTVLLLSLLPVASQAAALADMQRHLAGQAAMAPGVARALAPQLSDLQACVSGAPREASLPPFHGWARPGQAGVLAALQSA